MRREGMATLTVVAPEDAADAVERFNAFHDGFIREVSLRSRDRFSGEESDPFSLGHHCTGEFDAVIDFAHYNYGGRIQPLERVVRGRFMDVMDFRLDLHGVKPEDWPIRSVEIEPATRTHPRRGEEGCFRLRITWSHLDGEAWSSRSEELFSFLRGEFEEHDETESRTEP
jgi:hypothetical protein